MTQSVPTKRFLQSAILLAMAFGAAVPASANLVNGDFAGSPTGQFQTLPGGSTLIPGWTVFGPTAVGSSVDWIGSYWQAPPPGGHSIDLDGNSPGGVEQKNIATTIGQMYDLSFYLSGNPDGSPTTKEVKVTATGTAGEVYSYNIGSNSEANMKYVLESYIFTATSTSTTVGFVSFDTPGAYGAVIGGVNLSATPEPGFYGVLALGLSGLFYAFLRRRRQA